MIPPGADPAPAPPGAMGGLLAAGLSRLFAGLPEGLPEWLYTGPLSPWPLRRLTNLLIRGVLPATVRFGDAVVHLNPADPVVSGALAFRVFENAERRFLLSCCRPGMTVLDIGANVGYFSAVAARAVGPTGRVVALEPDPESFGFLARTAAANPAGDVRCFRLAAAAVAGRRPLYRSRDNRGDNRLYPPAPGWDSIEVEAEAVDALLGRLDLPPVDFIKVDVQGAEALVFDGMRETIRASGSVVVMSEFWPAGLEAGGSDPLGFLDRLEGLGLELFELDRATGGLGRVRDKPGLVRRYPGRKFGTLVGRRGARESGTVGR